jgi:Ca-activated chloride channel family protein
MKWARPELLHLLWLLIPAALVLFALARRRLRMLHQLADAGIVGQLAPGWRPERVRTRLVLWLLAVGLLIMALARPQWGFHWEEVKRRGLDILVVLDTSRSMLAEDVKPNRLQQSKWGIRDLVRELRGDRIGLVAFAGSSFLQCPLTIDYAAFLLTLDDVYAGIIPRGGTAIRQALLTAMEGFEDQTEADRAIILVTDGEDHEADPLDLVDELKEMRIRVFAIGIGSLEGELIPAAEGSQGAFFKDREGQAVKTALREDVLEKLALATGGAYVRSAAGDTGLERVFREGLSKLKRDEAESRMVQAYEDRFGWFIAAALALLALEAALSDKDRRKDEATPS